MKAMEKLLVELNSDSFQKLFSNQNYIKDYLESRIKSTYIRKEEEQQRELLIAFFESVDAEDIEQQRNGKGWKVVDRYLKEINQ